MLFLFYRDRERKNKMNIIYIITSIILILSYLLVKKKEEKLNIIYSIIITAIKSTLSK